MTIPNDPHDADFRATLPADLQELDRELSGIRIEERPSFGPELEGELTRAWQDERSAPPKGKRPWVRTLMAASLAGLMIAGVSVPSARAAVFQLVRTVAQEAFPGLFTPEPQPEPQLPEIEVQEPPPALSEVRAEVAVSPADVTDEAEATEPALPTLPRVDITLPGIISRDEAAETIARYYPRNLQLQGVEGSVKLLFWIDAQGNPEQITVQESSGHPSLDNAAMRAAREIRFRPATRNGIGVGTWVEVGVKFFAHSGAGIIG